MIFEKIKGRKIRYGILATVWFAAILSGFVFCDKERVIFPSQDIRAFYSYGDESDGGNSTASWRLQDSSLLFSLNVQEGIAYPYAGLGILLNDDPARHPENSYDFTPYDSVCVVSRSERLNQIQLRILTFDPALTTFEKPLSARYLFHPLPLSRSKNRVCMGSIIFPFPNGGLKKIGLPFRII